jgi:hypothetical protein
MILDAVVSIPTFLEARLGWKDQQLVLVAFGHFARIGMQPVIYGHWDGSLSRCYRCFLPLQLISSRLTHSGVVLTVHFGINCPSQSLREQTFFSSRIPPHSDPLVWVIPVEYWVSTGAGVFTSIACLCCLTIYLVRYTINITTTA